MSETLFFVTVLALLVANLVVGYWPSKEPATFRVYRADPDRRGWAGVATTLTGTVVGGGMFLAVGQIGFEAGVVGYFIGAIYLLGLAVIARFARHIRQEMAVRNADTLLELISDAYSKRVVQLFAIVNLAMYVFLLAAQFVAIFYFAKFLDRQFTSVWMPWTLVGFASLSMLLYPVWGGLRKDVITDYFQVAIVAAGGVLLATRLLAGEFFRSGLRSLPVDKLDGTGYGVVFLMGVVLFLGPLFLVRMDVWQRIRTAKSDRDAQVGLLVAGLASFGFYVLFSSIGMAALVGGMVSGKEAALDWIFGAVANEWALALLSAAFFFAVLSSADTFINNASLFLSWLIGGQEWRKCATDPDLDSRALWNSRLSAVGVTVGAILLAFLRPNFVDLFVGAFSLLLIFLPTVAGLFVEDWRNSTAALVSGVVGVVTFAVLFLLWDPTQAFVPAVILASIVHAVVARAGRPEASRRGP